MRAVFILRSAFDLSFSEIGQAIERSAVACRQAHSRAKRMLAEYDQDLNSEPADRAQLEQLIALIQNGEPDKLAKYLAQDIALESDGGTTAPAFGQTIRGRDRIAKFLCVSPALLGLNLKVEFHGSEPGIFFTLHNEGMLKLVTLASSSNNRIVRIFAVSDRDKLEKFGQRFNAAR